LKTDFLIISRTFETNTVYIFTPDLGLLEDATALLALDGTPRASRLLGVLGIIDITISSSSSFTEYTSTFFFGGGQLSTEHCKYARQHQSD